MRKRTDDRARKEFIRRLRLALDQANISQNELARRTKQSSQGVSDWFTKDSLPGGAALLLLPKALGVSATWLIEGTGPMAPANAGTGETFEMGGRTAFAAMRTALRQAECQWGKGEDPKGGRP